MGYSWAQAAYFLQITLMGYFQLPTGIGTLFPFYHLGSCVVVSNGQPHIKLDAAVGEESKR